MYRAWSLATGRISHLSRSVPQVPKPAIIDAIESSEWIPYTDDGMPLSRNCRQPSNVRSVYQAFCELSELVQATLYVLYTPGRPTSSRDIVGVYTKYLNWYNALPEALRLGRNFTPAVLFVQ